MDSKINFTQDQLDLIKKTCIPKAADKEHFDLFIYTCQKYGLDPLTKEIVLDIRITKTGEKKAIIITTRDGYLKAAMQDPAYNGVNSGVIKEGDQVEIDPIAGSFKHSFGAKRGKITAAWSVAKAKNRDPIICSADFEEYYKANQSSYTWKGYPSAMIQKVAEIMAMKRQFNITGLVGEEEISTGLIDTLDEQKMPDSLVNPHEPVEPPKSENSAPAQKPENPEPEKDHNPAEQGKEDSTGPEKASHAQNTLNVVVMGAPRKKNGKEEYGVHAVLFGDTEGEYELVVPAAYKDFLVDGAALLATGYVEDDKFISSSVKPVDTGEKNKADTTEVVKLLSVPVEGGFVQDGKKIYVPWAYVEYKDKTEGVFAAGKSLAGFTKGDIVTVRITDTITKDNKIMLFVDSAEKAEQIAN